MAEVYGLFHNDEAARSPAATAYKLLYTVAQGGPYSVHVCNRNTADVTIRIAILTGTDADGYSDGGTPPGYAFVVYGRRVEGDGGEYDTPSFSLAADDKIVVWADTANVNFMNHGIAFS